MTQQPAKVRKIVSLRRLRAEYARAIEDQPHDHDERLAVPLDPEEALRALLKVDPESEPVEPDANDQPAPRSQPRQKRSPS